MPTRAERPRPEEVVARVGPKAPPWTSRVQSDRDQEGYAWVRPTSSNRARPRTLLAGYNPEEQTLRVMFRDGTPWDYYDVDPATWDRFKRSASPGRFINRVLNSHRYQEGRWTPP